MTPPGPAGEAVRAALRELAALERRLDPDRRFRCGRPLPDGWA